jgi:hypothetical protein
MDNTDPINKLDKKVDLLLKEVREKILIANMSLAVAMETPFIATYENKDGICSMAIRSNNTAILAATATAGTIVHKSDILIAPEGMVERRAVFKLESEEDAEELWDLINERMYAWSQGDIDIVDIE